MKKNITRLFRATFLLASVFLLPLSASAQDLAGLEGYANVFVRVKAAIEGSGKVSVTPPAGGLESYKDVVDFNRTLPVSMSSIYFNVKERVTDGYTFIGWYLDDGDGVFDIDKDEVLSLEEKSTLFIPLLALGFPDDYTLFETEAEAKQGEHPSEPQATVFAYFTNGASVMVDHSMNLLGSIEVSKPVNEKGDQITIKAIPAEGCQFEYWKSAYGSQILSDDPSQYIVSREAEYTFTVQGGEKLYAYFSQTDAPVLQFPEEGGWKAIGADNVWILHEQSGAKIYLATLADIITNDQGQSFLNPNDEDAWYDNTHNANFGTATLIYGKGEVRFCHLSTDSKGYILNFGRPDELQKWSGSTGITITDKNNERLLHVYTFRDDLGAFVKHGTTDVIADPNAGTSVFVPANTCYMSLEAMAISNPETGFIPDIIGMSPELYDSAATGIEEVDAQGKVTEKKTLLFDLQGRQVTKPQKGIYIVNGKKIRL